MSNILILFLALTVTTIFTGCKDNSDPGPNTSLCSSMVTYDGTDSDGKLMFSYTITQANGSDHLINLTADASFTNKVAVGTRLELTYRYLNGLNYPQSGPIYLISAQKAWTAPISIGPAPTSVTSMGPIAVKTLIRAGEYIDLWCRVARAEGRTFSITLDEATENTSNPILYISTSVPSGNPEEYMVNYPVSFNVASVWNNPATQILTVKINNSTNPHYSTFNFPK